MRQAIILSKGLLGVALALIAASASAADIWKCSIDGRVVLSDKPCPGAGAALAPRLLQGNVVQATKPVPADPQIGTAAMLSAPPTNACPDDQALRNMETAANAGSLDAEAKAFLRDEIRRVRQCRKGEGRYTADDWRISREAQAAQSNSTGRREARIRAEGMHSAADPAEGERIARLREQAAADERRALANRRGQHSALSPQPLATSP